MDGKSLVKVSNCLCSRLIIWEPPIESLSHSENLFKVLSSFEHLFASFHNSVMKTDIMLLQKRGRPWLGIFIGFVVSEVASNLHTFLSWVLLTVYYILLSHMNYI